MINNFPRLQNIQGRPIGLEELRKCFPWGCSQLTDKPVLQGNCEVIRMFSRNFSNIFKAIKYGIWSLHDNQFLSDYHKFRQLKAEGRKLYYAFMERQQEFINLYGIAQVIDFEPGGMFKYWTPVNQYSFFGLIKIKFISVGCLLADDKSLQYQIELVLQRLALTSLSWQKIQKSDEEEDCLRSNYKQQQQIFYKEKLNTLSRKSQDPLQFAQKKIFGEPRLNLQRKKY